MKAALAGAATGSAYVAPRVSGFTVAPDYAAAATCATQTITIGNQTSTNAIYCACAYNFNCWANDAGLCNCNTTNKTASVTLRGATVNASVTLRGAANSKNGNAGCNNFQADSIVVVNGIDTNKIARCDVNWFIANDHNGGLTFNANGTVNNAAIRHTSNGTAQRNITLTLTCNCK